MPDIEKIITPDNQEYNVKDLDAIHSIDYRTVEGQLVVYYTKDGVSGTGFLTVDSTATQNSNNPITSGYVYTLSTSIAGKADVATTVSNVAYTTRTLEKTINGNTTTVFTCDNTPVQNSNNPITSGAVYTVLDDTINTVLESVLGGNS